MPKQNLKIYISIMCQFCKEPILILNYFKFLAEEKAFLGFCFMG